MYGISSYEWTVGSEPNAEDIQPYGDDGIVLVDNLSGKFIYRIPRTHYPVFDKIHVYV